ncbi:hypothetical protein C4573_07355 [Candidatus Woesearchaeota archaeon]|nr:MAG: hypothetical protein C4573_07355 [Candidatus Woesearchaeota archaeon]
MVGYKKMKILGLPLSALSLAVALKVLTPSSADAQTAQKDSCDCGPKYEELNFIRNPDVPTFSAREIWTLDRGKGADLLVLDCNSTLENILELVDFRNRAIKENILSGNYETIEDTRGRVHSKIETRNGTRYFTIQSRDEANQGIVGIDGKIDYERLKNHGNKVLRLYVMIGKDAGMDKRTHKPVVQSIDSGDLLIPYCDCIIPPAKIEPTKKEAAVEKMPTMHRENKHSCFIADDMKETSPDIEEMLNANKLVVNVLGGQADDATQDYLYECGPLTVDSKPLLWKISTYAKVLDYLHLNAKLQSAHANVDFLDPNQEPIGKFSYTATDFLVDARGNLVHAGNAGIGIGGIFEQNATTQSGRIYSSSLEGSSNRYSGLGGIVLFVHTPHMSNLSAGVYVGHSSQLGDLMNGTVRLDAFDIDGILDVDSHLFLEKYDGDHGKGTRSGFGVLVGGPKILGFISPALEYEFVETLHPYADGNVTSGSKSSIFGGIRMDLGKYVQKSQ